MAYWSSPAWIDFDRLGEHTRRAVSGESSGEQVEETLKFVCRNPTSWQWVIHGDTGPYREVVTEELCHRGTYRVAERFAKCGIGEVAEVRLDGSEARVRSRFCGHRGCPRCSRIGGLRMLGRVTKVLGGRPHGAIGHICLTQVAERNETLAQSKARFQAKWKRLEWFRRDPDFVGGLASFHLKLGNDDAWHYHVHFMMESTSPETLERLSKKVVDFWRIYVCEESGRAESMFRRILCGPGAAFDFGGGVQGELFGEPEEPIAKALAYGLRDVVQGIERWVAGGASRERITEFLDVLSGAKLHRLFGSWRSAAAGEKDEEGDTERVKEPEVEDREWVVAGSMEEVIREARGGVELCVSLLRSLLTGKNGRSLVRERLERLCKSFL